MTLQLAPKCCCCPTKEEVGLPDCIKASFSVDNSSDTGMPADEQHDECGTSGNFPWTRWEHNDALVNLLTDIEFEFQGADLGGCPGSICCFRYSGKTNYTHDPGDTLGCNSLYDEEAILFGDPLFENQRFYNVLSFEQYASGAPRVADSPCYTCTDPSPAPPWCCDGCVDCSLCGDTESWSGTKWVPLPIVGNAGLVVCVEGSVVVICGVITMYFGSLQKVGTYERFGAARVQADPCIDQPEEIDDQTTTTCFVGEQSFVFQMSADLSAVSGSTIWEKIKNYTGWSFGYEYAACGPPAGCMEALTTFCNGRCTQNCDCTCVFLCEGDDGAVTVSDPDDPQDQICYYSVGELAVTFSECAA